MYHDKKRPNAAPTKPAVKIDFHFETRNFTLFAKELISVIKLIFSN
jgi:hypothetical protein